MSADHAPDTHELLYRRLELILAAVTAVLLTVDAVVHLRDARFYAAPPSGLGQATLFRWEAAAALIVAVAVALLLRRHPVTWLLALLVAGTAAAAVLLSTYVDIGRIGPIPDLYEPTWNLPGKLLSAIAEALAAGVAAVGLVLSVRGRHRLSPSGERPGTGADGRRPGRPNGHVDGGRADHGAAL